MTALTLKEDYLGLLASHGLSPRTMPRSLEAVMTQIRNIASRTTGNNYMQQQTLKALEAMNEKFPGAVDGFIGQNLESGTRSYVDSYVQLVLKTLETMQGADVPIDLYFDEFPTAEFNANAILTDNGALCLLNQGLAELLWNVSVASSYSVVGIEKDEGTELKLPGEKTSADDTRFTTAAANVVGVLYEYLVFHSHSRPRHFEQDHDMWGMIVAAHISRSMRTFVVAHEISHVVLGHLDRTAVRHAVTPAGTLDVLLRSEKEEFEADLAAQVILIQIDKAHRTLLPSTCGGVCFLAVHLMLQHLWAKMKGQVLDESLQAGSHPPSSQRINVLGNFLEKHSDRESFNRAMRLYVFLDKFVESIASAEVKVTSEGMKVSLNKSGESE